MPLHRSLLHKPQLRKSPVRTRALLSANRANALRSTGPRTSRGKHASALNALRHGRRAQLSLCWVPQGGREADAFWRFEAQLRDAILPLAGKGEQQVFERALRLWVTKRLYDRLAVSADEDRRMHLALGLEPMPASYRSRTLRPGISVPDWMVTVSIGVAWGRGLGRFQQYATELASDLAAESARPTSRCGESGPTSRCSESGPTSRCSESGPGPIRRPMPRLPSLHARLVLTTVGHPYSDNTNDRQGAARLESGRGNRRTKPECLTRDATFENEPWPCAPRPSFQEPGFNAGGDHGIDGPDGYSPVGGEAASASHSGSVSSSEPASQPTKASQRTKPECIRKREASKNVPRTDMGGVRSWLRRGFSRVRGLFTAPEGFHEKRFSKTGPLLPRLRGGQASRRDPLR